ncbi:hypothetical protein M404DRAFT_473399 [Pisolithus tinctorius Marx 270]|uniref:Uncharacterized protein n=1 Tax=Pisolithus tinctorius Marx 270 TaxID=870435 RepID=A0A0C3KXR8_PISTI|nr:hypothetical protein M404DRAFT_473399 [Pisolithus tinctorius Marx 270]
MRVLSLAMYPADIRAMSTVDFEGLAGVFKKSEWAAVEEVRVVISNKEASSGSASGSTSDKFCSTVLVIM